MVPSCHSHFRNWQNTPAMSTRTPLAVSIKNLAFVFLLNRSSSLNSESKIFAMPLKNIASFLPLLTGIIIPTRIFYFYFMQLTPCVNATISLSTVVFNQTFKEKTIIFQLSWSKTFSKIPTQRAHSNLVPKLIKHDLYSITKPPSKLRTI